MNKAKVFYQFNIKLSIMIILIIFGDQSVRSQNTMEQFLDLMLHESVYDRRARPFLGENISK